LVHENVCMITIARQQSDIFQQYHSEKHLSEFYPQDGGESQLASKLRHYHPIDIELGLICVCRQRFYLLKPNAPAAATYSVRKRRL